MRPILPHRCDRLRRRSAARRALLAAACASARSPATRTRRPPRRASRSRKGDVVSGEGLDEALERRRRRLLPHPLDGPRQRAGLRRARPPGRARTSATPPRDAGVQRVVYLGGLGPTATRVRAPAQPRRGRGDPRRARPRARPRPRGDGHRRGQRLVRDAARLVERLPAMITPRWIDTRHQPVAIARRRPRARRARRSATTRPTRSQLGGADVLTYREMMERYAGVAGRRRRAIVSVPVLTPRLSSLLGRLRHAGRRRASRGRSSTGLRAEMVVDEPPPPGLNDHPMGFDDAVRAALDTEPLASPRRCSARALAVLLVRVAPLAQARRPRAHRHPDEHTTIDGRPGARALGPGGRPHPARRGARRDLDARAPRAPRAHVLALPVARDARAHPRRLHRATSATWCC